MERAGEAFDAREFPCAASTPPDTRPGAGLAYATATIMRRRSSIFLGVYQHVTHFKKVLARLTWASKPDQGAEAGTVMRKELSLPGIQRPLYPGELGEDAVEVFRFGDFAGWIIEG